MDKRHCLTSTTGNEGGQTVCYHLDVGRATGHGGGRVTFRTGEPAMLNTRDPKYKWIFQGDIFDMNESYIRNKRLNLL